MTNLKNTLNLRYTPGVYTSLFTAQSSIKNSVKKCWTVVLGDNNKFWVVCFADAAKLERAGYEIL